MKQILALGTAFLVTSIIGFGMLVIGANAATNPDSIPVSNSPDSPVAAINTNAQLPPGDVIAQYQAREQQYQAQINQLNNLIAQYQSREKQYQTQLNQVTSQAQQTQQILDELQRRGVIRILSDGTIQLLVRRN